jgi:spore germination protein YaaH
MLQKTLITGLAAIGIFLGVLFTFSWQQHRQITFPVDLGELSFNQVLGTQTRVGSGETREKLGIVYGFLPYWNVADYQVHQSVTHLAYFRLAVNGKGEIITEAGDGGYQILSGERMQQIITQINRSQINYEITFFSSQSNEIAALIDCDACQEQLLANMADVIATNRLDGINLDFEYLGTVSAQERQSFTNFVYKVRNLIDRDYPRTKLSIDVYGGAAEMQNIWDFPKLAKIIDRVIVMGYDYKTRRSSVPGPTAPTLGKDFLGGDIWEDIRSLMRFIPSEKIILAVPFYGYAWETTTADLETAQTYSGSGETMTYRGARTILSDPQLGAVEHWDERSLTPYLTYFKDDRWHIGFFENPRSLGYKIDLIDTLNLGGIAIWALGYEGDYQELWDTIAARF